jgi:hypothetical protein
VSEESADVADWRASVLRSGFVLAVFMAGLILGGCGDRGEREADPISAEELVVRSERDEHGELCYSVQGDALRDGRFADCVATGEIGFFLARTAVPLREDGPDHERWATVYVMDIPYEVTGVAQEGRPVRWLQDGDVVVVLGGRGETGMMNTAETEIRFVRGPYPGVCKSSGDGGSCQLDVIE